MTAWTLILERVDVDEVDLPDLKDALAATVDRLTGSRPSAFTTVSTVQYEAYLGLCRGAADGRAPETAGSGGCDAAVAGAQVDEGARVSVEDAMMRP